MQEFPSLANLFVCVTLLDGPQKRGGGSKLPSTPFKLFQDGPGRGPWIASLSIIDKCVSDKLYHAKESLLGIAKAALMDQ